MDQEKIRAFLALPLAEAFEASARLVVTKLKSQFPEVKWVNPSQIHVTLHFFGDIDLKQTEKISRCVALVTQTAKPFHLLLRGLGGFPNDSRPRIIWTGIEGEAEALASFHLRLEDALKKAGFEGEKRPFKPHLTLGRVREGKKPPVLRGIEFPPTEVKSISEIILFKSVLSSEGPKYETLHSFPLSAS